MVSKPLHFTPEQIRSKVMDHIGYGWTPRPGTHMSNYAWTPEDTALYMQYWDEIIAQTSRSVNAAGGLP